MRRNVKVLLLIVVVAVVVAVAVYAYYLTLPRVSLLVYKDSKVTGCVKGVEGLVILHVKNDGTVDLYINACAISYYDFHWDIVTYIFQSDIVIPVGVEAVITFPTSGGEVTVETLSGPPGAVASGGVYAVSDNPNPNPATGEPLFFKSLKIYTRAGQIRHKGITIE